MSLRLIRCAASLMAPCSFFLREPAWQPLSRPVSSCIAICRHVWCSLSARSLFACRGGTSEGVHLILHSCKSY